MSNPRKTADEIRAACLVAREFIARQHLCLDATIFAVSTMGMTARSGHAYYGRHPSEPQIPVVAGGQLSDLRDQR
jgi:hypothetical protein